MPSNPVSNENEIADTCEVNDKKITLRAFDDITSEDYFFTKFKTSSRHLHFPLKTENNFAMSFEHVSADSYDSASTFREMATKNGSSSAAASPNRKVALITGITGQDGSYLAEFLLEKGYEVFSKIQMILKNIL